MGVMFTNLANELGHHFVGKVLVTQWILSLYGDYIGDIWAYNGGTD